MINIRIYIHEQNKLCEHGGGYIWNKYRGHIIYIYTQNKKIYYIIIDVHIEGYLLDLYDVFMSIAQIPPLLFDLLFVRFIIYAILSFLKYILRLQNRI